jgi:sulfoxide reductase heme-binding subunit YedZ
VLTAAVGTNSQALWYMTRGFGLVALILLTITMVLGLTQAVRYARPGLPRFVISALHKNASLLAVVLLVIHIVTAVLDTYAPIRIVDVFIPFISHYRPFWLGLGAISLDVLVALVVTSLLRERLGHRAWRTIHWAAFACWPLAVVHGLGTGSDTKLGWVLVINAACVGAVLAALWWRLASGWSIANSARRGVAVLASVALPVTVAAWTVTGPLRPGWSRRAGTPTALIGARGASTPAPSAPATAGSLATPFSAPFTGAQKQTGPDNSGLVYVTISGTFSGASSGRLTIVLTGQPAAGGGVQLTGSQVQLGPAATPTQYQGRVTQLQGSVITASLTDAAGRAVSLVARLQISSTSSTVSGTLQVSA